MSREQMARRRRVLMGGQQPPTAPDASSILLIGPGVLRPTWVDQAEQEDGFTLQRSPDGSAWATIATVAESPGTGNAVGYTDSGLVGGNTYHYRVRAFNNGGVSAWVALASGTAP